MKYLPVILAAVLAIVGLVGFTGASAETIPPRWDHSCLTWDRDSPLLGAALDQYAAVSGIRDCGPAPRGQADIRMGSTTLIYPTIGNFEAFTDPAQATIYHAEINIAPAERDNLKVYLHEVGHALGLSHSKEGPAIMQESINPFIDAHLQPADIAAVRSVWPMPVRTRIFLSEISH